MSILLVAAGGFIGACCRFYLSISLNGKGKWGTTGTWLANLTGSALLGYLWIADTKEWLWLVAGVGFAGAFTTFSTFGKETIDFLENGETKKAVYYVLFTVLSSLLIIEIIFAFFTAV